MAKYEPPKVVIEEGTWKEPGKYYGCPHYRIKCGSQEASLIGVKNLAVHFGMMMQECDRLRWIIREVDRRGGGTLVSEVSEETQQEYEVLKVE